MNTLSLRQTLPEAFADSIPESGVWGNDIEFHKGKTYLVEAISGAGKSSFCNYIYGFRKDYRGTIAFDGTDISTLSEARWTAIRRTSLSIQFQDFRLFPELTALENIMLKNNITRHKAPGQIELLLETMHISHRRDYPVGKLSLGEQQRVAFIRALCQPFDFILLDEPNSHIDASRAMRMAETLTEEARAQGAGIIATSIGNTLPLVYDNVFKL